VAEGVAELALEIVRGQVAAAGPWRARRLPGVRPPAAAREDGCGEEEQRGRAERAQARQETFTYPCFLPPVATIS
jgi:hypothetical protein